MTLKKGMRSGITIACRYIITKFLRPYNNKSKSVR